MALGSAFRTLGFAFCVFLSHESYSVFAAEQFSRRILEAQRSLRFALSLFLSEQAGNVSADIKLSEILWDFCESHWDLFH